MNKEQFTKSPEFVDAVIKSSNASYASECYYAEFFNDGTHRVLWSGQIGNLYKSAGELIKVPALTAEQCDEEDDEAGITLTDVVDFYRDELAADFLSQEA